MVWRNDNARIRRRLPTIPAEEKVFSILTRLNKRSMLPVVGSRNVKLPTLLITSDGNADGGEQLSPSEQSRRSYSPNSRLSFPVRFTQRRELPDEENYSKLKKHPSNFKQLFQKYLKFQLLLRS
ncbi:unnamed protein product [Onchocerca flexuosa]|uniref:Uncharacterized protein n=1 Tax=Onchocerca flexuosa TaxID=387005 RepID=A0A183H476_9BILA|nr:unnamed protein product [Onchocerca flexuosa]